MSDWLLNGEKRSEFETSGSKVTFKYQPNCSNYYNAMYLGLNANEKNKRYYWEFDISGGRCCVGLTPKKSFADGYKLSGCFFNGNLTDGSCLLVGEFGDVVSNGQKIGLIIDTNENELKVYIVQNGRPLGLAFVHPAPYSTELHPCISFCEPGSVEIKAKETANLDALLTRSDYLHKTIDGKYKIVRTIETASSTEKTLPDYTVSLKRESDDKIHLSVRVVNTVGGILYKTGQDDEGEIYNVESLMSTLMAGEPEEMQNEFFLSSVIHNLKRLKFNENLTELTILSPKATLHLKRYLPSKEPHRTNSLLNN